MNSDKINRVIERVSSLVDLVTAIIFLLIVVRVYKWIDELLVLVGVQ